MSTPKVLLITGASSGLGLALTHAALSAGHKVLATMRNPSANPTLVTTLEASGNCKVIPLDVTSPTLTQDLLDCIPIFGRIDVLINNAGYGYGGPLEDCDVAESRKLVETLFWGPILATKALIPHFRAQGSGTVVNISSAEAITGQPALTFYSAAKHALEGASEALAGELAPFNIKVLIIQPGGIRTSFMDPARMSAAPLSSHYENTPADIVMQAIRAMDGKQGLDPEKCARRIVEAIDGGKGEGWPEGGMQGFLRLPLGREVLERLEGRMEREWRGVEGLGDVARSCDFEEGV